MEYSAQVNTTIADTTHYAHMETGLHKVVSQHSLAEFPTINVDEPTEHM